MSVRLTNSVFRFTFAFIVLIVLFTVADLRAVLNAMKAADPGLLALATLAVYAVFLLRAIRWRQILAILANQVAVLPVFLWSLAGNLLNFFLPTSIGGDIGRWYLARNEAGSGSAIAVSLVLDRVFGSLAFAPLVAILATVGIQTPSESGLVMNLRWAEMLIMIGLTALLILAVRRMARPAGRERIRALANRLFPQATTLSSQPDIGGQLSDVLEKMGSTKLVMWLPPLLMSLVAHVFFIVAECLLAHSVGIEISLKQMSLLYLVSAAAMMVPVSPNGLGIREGISVWYLAQLGNPIEAAVGYSILSLAVRFCACLPAIALTDFAGARNVRSETAGDTSR